MVVYGGDEVSAIVLDIGTSTTVSGYAGEDCPKSVIPSSYGYIPESASPEDPSTTLPARDGIVQDWNSAERLIEHALRDGLHLPNMSDYPLLNVEAPWNSKDNRERMLELAFEGWDAPAYFSVDRAVSNAFSSGRASALIVDIGEDVTSVCPVYDGYVLRKAVQKSPIAGSLLSNLLASVLRGQRKPADFRPHYLIRSKAPVKPNQPAEAILRDDRLPRKNATDSEADRLTTDSFHIYQVSRIMHDFKESVCQVFEGYPWNAEVVSVRPTKHFEFPDGFNCNYSHVRFSIPEVFFNPQQAMPKEYVTGPLPQTSSTIPTAEYRDAVPITHMIINAINGCDSDMLPHLLANIVVVGGTSLMAGFTERLANEMAILAQGYKIKVHASGNTIERKYSSWLGGSILASLGTFHQLWIGKEYADLCLRLTGPLTSFFSKASTLNSVVPSSIGELGDLSVQSVALQCRGVLSSGYGET